jgi:DNA-directed RNA polymerase subunit RPC12/RpoP
VVDVTDTRFACSVCSTVFSDHRARVNPVVQEEDELSCPNCGSVNFEPYEFDPNAPLIDPLAGPSEEDYVP